MAWRQTITAFAVVIFLAESADDCKEQEEDSMLQLHKSAGPSCTARWGDPFATSSRVDCCEGLEMCLGKHGDAWSYRCYKSCQETCTLEGETMNGLPCCEGLTACDGEWNMDGTWTKRCYQKCNMGEYHPYFDATPDYLKIAEKARGVKGNEGKLSDNYYLVISDNGGCDGGCDGCCGWQKQVAQKMKDYVQNRKKQNENSTLLFVILVGDNFYWNGASGHRFESTWKDIYGDLTDVPWFAIMGNHDFGNADPEGLCPFFAPRVQCPSSETGCGGAKPFSNQSQSYACNQLNVDKGGIGGDVRANYHMPDYTYFYTIPELDFEMIAMDYNYYDFDGLGGNGYGPTGGARDVAKFCGGEERVKDSLARLRDASNKVMKVRADAAESKNVAIFNHYPDWAQQGINLRVQFLDEVSNQKKKGMRVLNFYGHTHIQQCDRKAEEGYDGCTDFLTGGGGGCCGDTPAGFVAIKFGDDGKQTTECFLDDACTIPKWPSMLQLNLTKEDADVCPHTVDDPRCPSYQGPQI